MVWRTSTSCIGSSGDENEVKSSKFWYHGGPESTIDLVLGGKIKTRETRINDLYTPLPGRVYLTRNWKYAIGYTIRLDSPIGTLLSLRVENEKLLWPDEDEIGRVISQGYLDKELNIPSLDKDEMKLYNIIIQRLSKKLKNNIKDKSHHEFELSGYDTWVEIGKEAIIELSKNDPDFLNEISVHFDRVSTTPDNLVLEEIWKIDYDEVPFCAEEWDENKFLHYAKPIKLVNPIHLKSKGFNKSGWFGEPQRHALAARGVRTR